ncbi:MAG: hypothetical protein KDJ52_00900 [Anaerolineae bacterium]|nr:hypothetical protein [Anaerolineae bacterium]
MKEINLQITIDEANLVLEALGNLPFARVYALIGKIQEQAGQQLNSATPPAETNQTGHAGPTLKE